MRNPGKITAWLIVWFSLNITLLLGLGALVVVSMYRLASVPEDIYNHPFAVTNAALDMQASIVQIRNHMLEISITTDAHRVQYLAEEISRLDSTVEADLTVVQAAFLGDQNRVLKLRSQLSEWRTLRTQIIAVALGPDRAETQRLVKGPGMRAYDQSNAEVEYIIGFARQKAATMVAQARQEVSSRLFFLLWLLGALFVSVIVTGTGMTWRIRLELHRDRQVLHDIEMRESKYRAVVETLADGFWIVDMSGRFLEVNDVYLRRSGYTREEMLSMSIMDVEALESEGETVVHLGQLELHGHDRFESEHRAKDGTIWPVEIVTNYWPIDGGRCFVFISDISERRMLTERTHLMANVFEHSGEAMLISDADNRIVNANAAFTALTGFELQDVLGQDPKILSSERQSPEFYQALWHKLLTEGHWQGEIIDRRKDGRTYLKWLSITAVRDQHDRIVNYIASFADITERKRAENEIRFLAYSDALTGLHNRFSLMSHLEQELARAKRTELGVALLFIDLDRFKPINDTLGHVVGDRFLVSVAHRIRAALREGDHVARLGGDEFVVVLGDVSRGDQVRVVAEKILQQVAWPHIVEGHELRTTPSIGISLFPGDGLDVVTLMQNADRAMYLAKSEGGNRYRFIESTESAESVGEMCG